MNFKKNIHKLDLYYPFLLASFPVLIVFSGHLDSTPMSAAFLLIGGAIIITTAFLTLFKFIFKNYHKAALIVSICILGAVYYGFFYDSLFGLKINGFLIGRHRYLFPFWDALFLALFVFFIFTKKNTNKVSIVLRYFSMGLITLSAVSIFFSYFTEPIPLPLNDKGDMNAKNDKEYGDNSKNVSSVLSRLDKNKLPDIYYIIPDMYANFSTLKKYYNYDSRVFSDYLNKKGFKIVENSRSNYSITLFSVASLFNMEYLDYLAEIFPEDYKDLDPLVEKIDKNRVKNITESLGYKYYYLASDAKVTGVKDTGDDIVESKLDNFLRQVLKTTLLRPFGGRYAFREKDINEGVRRSVLKTFDDLSRVSGLETDGPKFTYAHIMSPHGPFVFGQNGEKTDAAFTQTVDYPKEMEGFLNQSVYISKKIQESVDQILAKSKKPPVIIIASDHGPYLPNEVVSDEVRAFVRTQNFLAVYLPGKNKNIIPNNLSMVNIFRLVFNQYFGADFKFLENKSFKYDGRFPYQFKEVKES